MTTRQPMFAIESRRQTRMGEEVLWFRKLDNHWTHHNTRVQFYAQAEAKDIVDALPKVNGRVVRIIPASEVPS
tara:strand:- start:1328 stop:1546 length:219 start_codon:yes stop_codon:yes gene_type:complete